MPLKIRPIKALNYSAYYYYYYFRLLAYSGDHSRLGLVLVLQLIGFPKKKLWGLPVQDLLQTGPDVFPVIAKHID